MPKYRVQYAFDGIGSAIIEAENESEAEENFHLGEFTEEKETGENYFVISAEEIPE